MFFVFSCLRGYAVDWVWFSISRTEQQSFKESIERFARESIAPHAARIDESGEFPIDLLRASVAHGLLGVTIPPAWGGAGRDYVSYALAIEAVARASATVAAALVVTNSLVAELIAHAGSDAQKERWLRALATGEALGAFALSEPNAGTDAANQQTTAVRGRRRLHDHRPEGVGRQRGGRADCDRVRLHAAGTARRRA